MIKRSRAVYPDRFFAVLDPKGEYTPLADWLGHPGRQAAARRPASAEPDGGRR